MTISKLKMMTLKALFVEIYYTDYSQDLTLSKIAEYLCTRQISLLCSNSTINRVIRHLK